MLAELVDKIRLDNNCIVYEPRQLPDIPGEFDLPTDVIEFYRLCGGMEIYCAESSLGFRIMPADKITQVNPLIGLLLPKMEMETIYLLILVRGRKTAFVMIARLNVMD